MDGWVGWRAALVAALAAVALAVAAPAGRAADCLTPRWVPSWTTAPTNAALGGFEGQTVREIVTPHLGGTQARLRLSNRFGAEPVRFDAVTLGRRAAGAAIVPGTLEAVTFGGERSVVVAPGGEAVSDPIPLRFAAFDQLAVSLFLADGTGPATQHFYGRHPVYATPQRSDEDRSGDVSGEGFDELETTATFFVTGLEVLATGAVGTVVALGDSLTDGYGGSPSPLVASREPIDADGAYPDVLQRRLLLARGAPPLVVLNAGISGNRILDDGLIPIHGPSMLARLAADVLAQPAATTVIVLAGANDIGGRSADAPRIIAGLGEAVARVRASGKRALLGTLTPMEGARSDGYGDAAAAATRAAVNAWIRGGRAADGVVDFDAALRDPDQPGRLRPAYDSGDGLHPNLEGYRAMADAVDLALLAALPQPRPPLRVTVPARYRARMRTAVVLLDGRRVGTIRRPRGAIRVDLRRARRAVATVRVRTKLSNGRTATTTLRVARCSR